VTAGASNEWVAFAGEAPWPSEHDIYLVRAGQAAHRIIGSDADGLDQMCPAVSSDGRRLAHGEVQGTHDTGYHGAALVISDIDAAGNVAEALRIDVGGAFPPCATWSLDGARVAFGVPAPYRFDPVRPASASAVWVVTLAGAEIAVVPDLLATDLAWSPDGATLAIASRPTELVAGQRLRDPGAISLYTVASGAIRTLVGPSGVSWLSWSPDGTRIAYQRGSAVAPWDQKIWVAEADGSAEYLLASGFSNNHGIGPVWSPAGEWIVYQRRCTTHPFNPPHPCSEQHEVVLLPAGGELGGRVPGAGEVVLPHLRLPGTDAAALWFPSRVTWSSDGTALLYLAWSETRPVAEGDTALIAVPIGPNAVPVVLSSSVSATGTQE
jgi:hypothetical protein